MKRLIAVSAIIMLLVACKTLPTAKESSTEMVKLTEGVFYTEQSQDVRIYYIKSNMSCGMWGLTLAYMIYSIDGVSKVEPIPYEFTITKSPLYDWPPIDKRIKQAIDVVKYKMEEYPDGFPQSEQPRTGAYIFKRRLIS